MALILAFFFLFCLIDIRIEKAAERPTNPAFARSLGFITPHELAQTTLYAFPILDVEVIELPLRPVDGRLPGAPQGHGTPSAGLRVWGKEEVKELIRVHASNVGVSVDLVTRIAECESGLRWDARNPHSTASGVMQYLSGTWANTEAGRAGISVFDADANIRMAVTHIAVHGTSPWRSSQACWDG